MVKMPDYDTRATRVGALTLLPQIVADLGHDPAAVFAQAGLDPVGFAEPDALVAMGAIERLFAAAIALTGQRDIGLRVGRRAGSAYIGAVRDRMAAEPDLRGAIQIFLRLAPVNTRSAAVRLVLDDNEARLEMGSLFHASTTTTCYDDGMAAITFYLLRGLLGGAWRPSTIELSHAPNGPLASYRAVFGLTPRFHCTRSAIVMPLSHLDLPLAEYDRSRREAAEHATLLTASRLDLSLVDRTRALIRARLSEPAMVLESVAGELGFSCRTLNRRLHAHGTSFAALLAETRDAVARHLLAETETPLGLIALALGYADQSAFSRAFHKRVGISPRDWRAANRR